MTSKDRMLTAFNHGVPDRVPVSPGISAMIPARLTGRPFWDLYLYGKYSPGQAYMDAVRHFKFDGWASAGPGKFGDDKRVFSQREIEHTDERIVTETACTTPAGTMTQETVYRKYDVPAQRKRYVKNLAEDFDKLKYFYPDPDSADYSPIKTSMDKMGDDGVMGFGVSVPGLHSMLDLREGGLESLAYDLYDTPDLIEQWRVIWHEHTVKLVKRAVEYKPDYIMMGASGLLTLQSPQLFRQLSLPTIKEVTAIARAHNIPSHLHACGKSKYLVEVFANETGLDSICPLEMPPMGDIVLSEIKNLYGNKLCFKGNIHTTQTMLFGSALDVENAAKKCIDDAAKGGGYILATGDQCGRDTPYENLFKLAEVARTYGKY